MKKFEYEITHFSPEDLGESAVIACSEDGVCGKKHVPADLLSPLKGLLDTRGAQGWELVNIYFGKGGALAFWKREAAGGGGY